MSKEHQVCIVTWMIVFASLASCGADSRPTGFAPYPWLATPPEQTLGTRTEVPAGFVRRRYEPESFGAWLRGLPVKPGRPEVLLYNGKRKRNQEAHHLVFDIDVGDSDLQQCADAVMRLRAEYLFASGRYGELCFRFTSGDLVAWQRWKSGGRVLVLGDWVTWWPIAGASESYANFRKYLDKVFQYAGSASLERDTVTTLGLADIEAGDIFVEGGFPGHAVIVADVAENESGQRIFLLAQSYMPAQEIHLLRNPGDGRLSPWYALSNPARLTTPEWRFSPRTLRRFVGSPCEAAD